MRGLGITMIVVLMIANLTAQDSWEEYEFNPVMTGTSGSWNYEILTPCVIRMGDTLKMWYAGYTGGSVVLSIGYAWSLDGIAWNMRTDPVLHHSAESWYGTHVWFPKVLYNEGSGLYQMWYAGAYVGMGYATSPDGINWTPDPGNPVYAPTPTGGWDLAGILTGPILFEDNVYKIWYLNKDMGGNLAGIGYATSSDGINWDKHPEQIIEAGIQPGVWDNGKIVPGSVIHDSDGYQLFYDGNDGNDEISIGHSTSPDGIENWVHNVSNPIVSIGDPGSWNSSFSAYPTVLPDALGEQYIMWMSGEYTNTGQNRIGMLYGPEVPGGVSVEPDSKPQSRFLLQNFPNPFNPTTTIQFSLREAGSVKLTILDITGREVVRIVNDHQPAGTHAIQWNGMNAAGNQVSIGVYFARFIAGDNSETIKMLMIK